MLRRFFATTLVAGLGLVAVAPAQAQPALEALEQKVRQDVLSGSAAQPGSKPTGAAPAAQGPAAEAAREPGYAGLIADDRDDRGRGVRIVKVTPGGPAEQAGLRPQDLITELGGVRVRQLSEMAMIMAQVPPGGKLEFLIQRGDQPQRLEVTFGRPPARPTTAAKPVEPPAQQPPAAQPPAADQSDLQSRIEALERRIEQLEQRIQALERALGFPEAKP
jgi:S1-C subfamily serine protease